MKNKKETKTTVQGFIPKEVSNKNVQGYETC